MPSKSKATFCDVATLLINDAEARVATGVANPYLLRNYRDRFRIWCEPYFKKTKIVDVNARMLREFRNHLAQRLSASSILAVMSFVSQVLKLALDDELIDQLPRIPRQGHKDSPRPSFTREEYRSLLKTLKEAERHRPMISARGQVVDGRLRMMVTFMVNSFLRPGDLFVLKHKHVEVVQDGEQAYLRLNLPPSKGHSYPVITMPVAAKIYERNLRLQQQAGFGKPDDYVFMPHQTNRRMAHEVTRRQFTAVLVHMGMKENAAGDEYTLYSLRHTAIMFRLLHAEDLDLLTLARACRTSVEMIDRFYAKPLTAEMNRDKLHSFKRPTRYAA